MGLSWAIAGSRVVDNKHHPADVVGGFFLGASVALIFVIRATACLKCASLLSCKQISLPIYHDTLQFKAVSDLTCAYIARHIAL